MKTREMLRLSWRAWLHQGAPRVGPWWIGHAWTVVFGLGIAAVFIAMSLVRAPPRARAGHGRGRQRHHQRGDQFLGAPGVLARRRAVGAGRLAAWSPSRRSIYFTLVPIAGVAVGWPLGMVLAGLLDERFMARSCGPACSLRASWSRSSSPPSSSSSSAPRRARSPPRNAATEAQLRLLQAQIEPHFLFNTLANVVSLMDADPGRAKSMLEAFVEYLRASLSGLGHGRHTLGDEIDLIDAYMKIIKIRMEHRLDYAIEVPEALRGITLPALTLQPLVENAIVHGLEPQIAGGPGPRRRAQRRPLARHHRRRRRRRARRRAAGRDAPRRQRNGARQHQAPPRAGLRHERVARHPRRRAARRLRALSLPVAS
jgi:hypothetical protein